MWRAAEGASSNAWIHAVHAPLALQAALVFLLALGIRLLGAAGAPLQFDELYTILAARSYLAEGSFRIWEGEYVRAPAYTVLVAASIGAFGDTLFAARLPSLIAGALLVCAAFWWLHRVAGPVAAWVLAALLGFSGMALDISQLARFYALHGLLFWLGATAIYAFLARPHRQVGYLMLPLAALALLSALHLQEITLIALAGLGAWAALQIGASIEVRRWLRARAIRVASLFALSLVAAIALFFFTDIAGELQQLYARYRWAALWNAGSQDRARFYVHLFAGQMPVLFYLFPMAALVAIARAPRPALFCLVVSGVALLLHSFAGMKHERYIYYTLPFVFSLWAIAAAALIPALVGSGATAWGRIREAIRPTVTGAIGSTATHGHARGFARLALAGIVAAVLAIALAGNAEYERVRALPKALADEVGSKVRARQDVSPTLAAKAQQLAALRKLVDSGAILVTSNELNALYFLGRYDLLVSASRLSEFAPRREFARDPRTGGPAISTAASLDRVIACYPTGSLLVWGNNWRVPHALAPEVADLVEAKMQEVRVPGELKVRAFRWAHARAPDADCGVVKALLANRSGLTARAAGH